MKVKKYTVFRVVFTALSVLIISFIFRNSLMNASVSTVQSTSVLDTILNFFKSIGIHLNITENFVRKCAHYVEFSVLAVTLFFMYQSYFFKLKSTVFTTLLTGFIVACIDEILQLFSYGRSAQFSDVLLDFSGVLITTAIISLVISMFINRRGREYKNE